MTRFLATTALAALLLTTALSQPALGQDMYVNPPTVPELTVGALLLPLGIGLAVGRRWPAARRWIPVRLKKSFLQLLACFVAFLVIAWSSIASVFREGKIRTAIVVITLIGLAIGHVPAATMLRAYSNRR